MARRQAHEFGRRCQVPIGADRVDMAKIGSESRQLPLHIRASMIEVLKGPNGESVPKIMDPRTALPSRASQTNPPNQLAESMLHLRQTQSCAEFRYKEAVVFVLRKDVVA